MELRLDQLAVDLGGRRVLGPLSLSVGQGQVVGLLGPNGAGKSTLMRAVAGLVDHSGAMMLDGQPLSSLSAEQRARLIAYMPQERIVGWSVTVESLVRLGRLPWRAATKAVRDKEIVARAMALADVGALAQRRATELSGGELARVLLARVIAQDTPFLVADEPAAGLDPAHQIATMQALRALAGQGRGVIVSLHDLTLSARWCDRLLVLSEGRLAADGDPAEVLTGERLRHVYGIEAHIAEAGGGLLVAPISLSRENPAGG